MKVKEVDDLQVKKNGRNKKRKKAKSKKEKHSKTKSKLQWPNWKAPFQKGSNLHTFSQAMMKKGGLTVKEFNRLVKKTGAKATWILKCLRKGSAGGWSWEYDDSNDRFRITDVKLNKKAA